MLTSDGYKESNIAEPHFEYDVQHRLWTFYCDANYARAVYYPIILSFLFRLKNEYNLNQKKIYFVDDAARAHEAVYEWTQAFINYLGGIHQKVAKSTTMYLQAADAHGCNGRFKAECIKRTREWRRQKLNAFYNIERPLKNRTAIGKLELTDKKKIMGELEQIMNGKYRNSIKKSFLHKFHPDFYDNDIQDLFRAANKYEKQYGKDKRNELADCMSPYKTEHYKNNLKKFGLKKYTKKQLTYSTSVVRSSHQCICGWTHSNKYNQERIQEHEVWCPILCYYGIVPALQPQNENNHEEWTKDFVGWYNRRKECKCIINIVQRKIHWNGEIRESIQEHQMFMKKRKSISCGIPYIGKPQKNKDKKDDEKTNQSVQNKKQIKQSQTNNNTRNKNKAKSKKSKKPNAEKTNKEIQKKLKKQKFMEREQELKKQLNKIRKYAKKIDNLIKINGSVYREGIVAEDLGFGYIRITQIKPAYQTKEHANRNSINFRIVKLKNLRYKQHNNVWKF